MPAFLLCLLLLLLLPPLGFNTGRAHLVVSDCSTPDQRVWGCGDAIVELI